jgi:membrane protease YdiL (CAAX protease family)
MVLWSAFLAFLILIIGQSIWSILLVANFKKGVTVPWSIPVMAIVLWLLWQYLGGKWWPHSTSQARHQLLRANSVPAPRLALAFVAGVFAIIALAGYWIVFFQIARTPPNVLPDLSKYPWLTIVLVLAMSSLVSPIVEEVGFRGYCQQILEREFVPQTAIAISSLLFMLAHANHGWYWSKLLVYFLVGIAFGAIAYLTNSILASIPVHIFGDAVFFTLIWRHDAARRLLSEGGADGWFWIHVAQAIIFTALALLAFRRLARDSTRTSQAMHATNSLIA